MKSIKPGRGPSALTGIMGIFMIGFGIVWTVLASRINLYAAFFGILWTGMAVAVTIYNLKNPTGKNRYSAFDITDDSEEPDPLNQKSGTVQKEEKQNDTNEIRETENRFCPYCGVPVGKEFGYCNNCGKKLP